MYKSVKNIKSVYSKPKFLKNQMFIISLPKRNIIAYNFKEIKINWKLNNQVHHCKVFDDEIFTDNISFYKIDGDLSFIHSEKNEFGLSETNKNLSVWASFDKKTEQILYHVFDLRLKKFIKKNIYSHGALHLLVDDLIFTYNYDNEFIAYNYIKEKNAWKINIAKLAPYKDPFNDKQMKGEFSSVQLYQKDKIILTTRYSFTFCLDINTGEEIWRSNTCGGVIEIVGNIGYVCTGLSLYRINLDTGKELSEFYPKNDRLPDIEYNNETYWASGYDVVYHEGLLWYAVYSSGHSFIIAINPDNGHYEWVHHVETYEKVMHISFYKNKMFLKDSGNTLHIYEKVAIK